MSRNQRRRLIRANRARNRTHATWDRTLERLRLLESRAEWLEHTGAGRADTPAS